MRRSQGYTQLSESDSEVLLPMRNKQATRGFVGLLSTMATNIRRWCTNIFKKTEDVQPILPLHNPFDSLYYEHQLEELIASGDKDGDTSEFTFDVPNNSNEFVISPHKTFHTTTENQNQHANDPPQDSNLLFNSDYIFNKLYYNEDNDNSIASQYQSLINNASSSDSASSEA